MSNTQASFVDGQVTITDDAGNSEALLLSEGDFSLSGVVPAGRALNLGETRGELTGARKGERTYPTISVSGKLSSPTAAFNMLALGLTAGFVSVTADIGDYPAVDFDFSFDYQAESRSYSGDDLVLTDFSSEEGSPYSKVSFTFQILGPLRSTGPEGTFVLVPSR